MKQVMSVTLEQLENINELFFSKGINVFYGAGGNGKRILEVFQKHGVFIQYFCDDDFNKWGKTLCEIPIISYDTLKEIAKKHKRLNVILTSVFGGPILKKLEELQDCYIFEPFSILHDVFYPKSFYNQPLTSYEKDTIIKKFSFIIPRLQDEESRYVMEVIRDVISNQCNADEKKFLSIASCEDCYFVHEVCEALPNCPVIVDCGGFTGDLMVALRKHEIYYDKCFSFEPNPILYDSMCHNISFNHLWGRFIPLNYGVWNEKKTAYLHFEENDIAGGSVCDEKSGITVNCVDLDSFLGDMNIDFVKMDIEGAELHALEGGISSIRRSRPILAISLYHSPHDVVDIPDFLMNTLKDYIFLIRHHSFIGSETVLYAIPH